MDNQEFLGAIFITTGSVQNCKLFILSLFFRETRVKVQKAHDYRLGFTQGKFSSNNCKDLFDVKFNFKYRLRTGEFWLVGRDPSENSICTKFSF